MTTFSITGKRHDGQGGTIDGTVIWTDGELSGDAADVADVQRLAKAYEGRQLRPIVGRESVTDHLKNPSVACMLMKMIFITGTTKQVGSLPKIHLPPGAIA